jgi:predicted nucleic acid-binding protein
MILLDTNYLIGMLVRGSRESEEVVEWYREKDLCTSSVCWYEFLCGPVTEESVEIVRGMLRERIFPFTADQAVESSRLFNAAGRARRLRVDAMIASCALLAAARLATSNREDFSAFVPLGLRLTE